MSKKTQTNIDGNFYERTGGEKSKELEGNESHLISLLLAASPNE